ncbi:putative T7SS-secreted protein [Sciscionella marina]|uniref:putative T7SS-secreted protein n=1 Tax=Sciscionella marina TaxID=508770 RepID=UPI00037EB9D2|nr:hypothetical protein [Sciscionella marina]
MVERKELGQTEDPKQLIPGEPAKIYENARVLGDRASNVDTDGQALKRIDAGGWTGKAHDSWREAADVELPKWLQTADGLDAAVTAVQSVADCLTWAQGQAGEAIARWKHGEALTAQAKADHEKAQADADAQTQASGGQVCVTPPPFTDPGEAERQAARQILDRARQQFQTVGDRSAQALNDLANGAPKPSESTGESIAHGVLDVAGFVPVLGDAIDGLHANWLKSEGRDNEAYTTAAAAVPFGGYAAQVGKITKWGSRGVEAAEKATEALSKVLPRSQIRLQTGPASGQATRANQAGHHSSCDAEQGRRFHLLGVVAAGSHSGTALSG